MRKKREKLPQELVYRQIVDFMNIVDKDKEKLAGCMTPEVEKKLAQLCEITQKLKEANEEARKLYGTNQVEFEQQMFDKDFRGNSKENRALERLQKLREELWMRKKKAAIRLTIIAQYEKGFFKRKSEKEKKKLKKMKKILSKKSRKRQGVKKFRKVGGKKGWLPL